MRRVVAFAVKWTFLTALAVTLGTALGAAYAYNVKATDPPAEALDPASEDSSDPLIEGPRRDRVAPPPPGLQSPRDGALVGLRPRLAWNAVADESPVIYAVELSTDPGFPKEATTTIRNLQDPEWRPDRPLAPLVRYHWRVHAIDAGLNEGPWSEPWSFTPLFPLGDLEIAPPP